MIKTLEERVEEMVEPKAAKAREAYYRLHNVPDEADFWKHPAEFLNRCVEVKLRTKSRDMVSVSNVPSDTLGMAAPELKRIQVTAEVLADFRAALIEQHGQIVIDGEGFKPTTNFEHHYLKHLWTHLESSAEYMLYQTKCSGTIWDGSKLVYRTFDAFKLEHNDGSATVFQAPAHEESLIQVFYYNTPVDRQVGLNGLMRFREMFNVMVIGTKHPAMISPCLMEPDEATPIAGAEWRFSPYSKDLTRLAGYWLRAGAVMPCFNSEPRSMLYFVNPTHTAKFKELLTLETKVNPYRLISKYHSIYDPELAGELGK